MIGNDKVEYLKDIILNMDAEVYVVRKDYDTIANWLEADYGNAIPLLDGEEIKFTFSDVQMAVDEAYEDPIIKKMINDGIGV